jgi:hypothetical protein
MSSTNKDKKEFEFIEHPDFLDNSSSIVKMWVLLEGSPDPEQFLI